MSMNCYNHPVSPYISYDEKDFDYVTLDNDSRHLGRQRNK